MRSAIALAPPPTRWSIVADDTPLGVVEVIVMSYLSRQPAAYPEEISEKTRVPLARIEVAALKLASRGLIALGRTH